MKKRNTIAVILILFICVAVYLNWNSANIESDIARFGAETSVEEPSGGDSETVVVEDAVETDKKEDSLEYFDEARMEKQKARDTAITTLKETMNEDGATQTSKDRAAESIETISTDAIAETRIETLVKAKGYADCIALINESGANVIVTAPAEGLAAGDITKIKDIVVSETNILPSEIKIIEIK